MFEKLASLALALTAGIAIACGGEAKPQASSTPSGPALTATSPASPGGATPGAQASPPADACLVAADVCTFAASVTRSLGSNDLQGVFSAVQLQEYTCPATRPQGLGGPYPLCDNAAANEKRMGFQVGVLASEGQAVNLEGLRAFIAQWVQSGPRSGSLRADTYGNAENSLFTIGCPAGVVPCGNQFVLVFSQRQANLRARIELLMYYERPQTSAPPRLVYAVVGPLLRPAEEQAALKGGSFQGFLTPQGWPPIQTFYPISAQ